MFNKHREKTKTITELIGEGSPESSFEEGTAVSSPWETNKEELKPIEEHEYKEAEKREEIPEERELGDKVWEDIKQEEKSKEKEEKKKGFFQRILSKITKVKISEKDFDEYSEELETLLLENNVALEVAEKIIKELKEKIVGKELSKKEIGSEINETFKETLAEILL